MSKQYVYKPPFRRTITINTLCVVGIATCIMIKIAAEKAFQTLGIIDIDIQPSTADNPVGDRSRAPDIILLEGFGSRVDEIETSMPETMVIEIKDLANQDLLVETITNTLMDAGWLECLEE